MKLHQLIQQYVAYRKALGEKFRTNEVCLKAFCRAVGPEIAIGSITADTIHHFLYAKSAIVTTGWFVKHTALLGMYQYAFSRNYINEIPLPKMLPKRPEGLIPYIYSQRELQLLFDSSLAYQKNKSHIDPYVVQTFLILTYTLGLRVHETLSITVTDIDLDTQVITISQSKFYKSRLLPFNQQIKRLLEKYLLWRKKHQQLQSTNTTLFLSRKGVPLNASTIRKIFQRVREKAGVHREKAASFQPRMHDLRHTFAVNRLLSWYREKKDVQQLLPMLSVYMGHTHLAHTSVYLSMTNDLLQEANALFEKYVKIKKS